MSGPAASPPPPPIDRPPPPGDGPRPARLAAGLGILAVVVAVVAVTLAVVQRGSGDDQVSTAPATVVRTTTATTTRTTLTTAARTSAPVTAAPPRTTPTSVARPPATTLVPPATAARAPTSAVAATTLPATTVAPPPADPAATPPVPAVTPLSGPGSPQLLNNPLPAGLKWDDVAPSLAVAQQLADALANDDWATARRIDTDKADSSDSQYAAGYGALDRASLMLLDARTEGRGQRLLLVSVANEQSGAQTSLYCLEWSVDPAAGTVRQHGGVVGQVARVAAAISPEGVRNDASLDAAVRTQCHWS
jgi:hypothetical protein